MEIVIGHTWDGQSVSPRHRTTIAFRQSAPRLIEVSVDAPFFDDPKPDQPKGRCPKLWEYEVAELFLVDQNGAYVEMELGPHGHYLALFLSGPRVVVDDRLAMDYSAKVSGGRWQGRATIVPPAGYGESIAYNAFAISGLGAERRFLAHYPMLGAKPDFHQPARFPRL